MATKRISALPTDAAPALSDVLPIDGATTRKTTIQTVADVGRPYASQAEAEAGTINNKVLSPLGGKLLLDALGMPAETFNPNGIVGDVFSRANHIGTQSADTLTDGTTNKAFLATERTKLTGIASGATANDTDANLKNRANHTGTQAQSTVVNLVSDLAAKAPLASPTFTGTPAAPTPAQSSNNTTVPTTAFVTTKALRLTNDAVNVLDTGAVGDNTADDAAAITAARNASRKVVIPGGKTYKVLTDPAGGAGGTQNVHYDIDPTSTFTGAGADGFSDFLYGRTNFGHKAIGQYYYYYKPTQNTPSGGGISPWMLEMVASDANEERWSAAMYVGAAGNSPHASANVWAINALVAAESGAGGIYQCIEVDVNTASSSAFTKGVAISGAGSVDADVALEISRGSNNWKRGIHVLNSTIAIKVDPNSGGAGIVIKSATADPSSTLETAISARQQANNKTTLFLQRETDSAPTGNFYSFVNAANNSVLAVMDVLGNHTIGGYSSAYGLLGGAGGALVGSGAVSTAVGASSALVPVGQFHGTGGGSLGAYRWANSNGGPNFAFFKSRGAAPGSRVAVQSGDVLGILNFNGDDGTNAPPGAQIVAAVDGTPGVGDMPGRIVFLTTPDGTSSSVERMRISQNGFVSIRGDGAVPLAQLDVRQPANSADTLVLQRFTDTTPAGYFLRAVNAANNSNLAIIDYAGNATFTGLVNGASFYVGANQVVGARATGWAAATGTATRTTFATGSVTLPQLAERVKALIDDLTTHGLIGA